MSGGHDVPPGWEHGRPVIPPRPPFRLPSEFLASRRGVQVGNVLETDDGAAAAVDGEQGTAR